MSHSLPERLRERIETIVHGLRNGIEGLTELQAQLAERLSVEKPAPCPDCFEVLDVMGILRTSPESATLLDTIVDVATVSVGAEAGSILLLDESGSHLSFVAVHGEKAGELKHLKLEVGHGIAGFVLASGQPLCVQDVAQSEQWDRSIAEAIQFETHAILAVPVICGSRVLGVLETVNKIGGGGFGQKEMDLLSQFAKIVGVAVEKRSMLTLGQSLLSVAAETLRASETLPRDNRDVVAGMIAGLEKMRASEEYRLALEIAAKIVGIATRSPRDAQLCLNVLNEFHTRLESRTPWLDLGGSLGR